MVAAVCGLLFAGYPVALTLGGVSLGFRGARPRQRRDGPRSSVCAAAAHLRRDDQHGAARDPAVHLHGRDAGALAHRRGPARDDGPPVRLVAGRPRHLGRAGRRAARGRQGRGRRDRRHHRADHAAHHAAPRLRQAPRRRHGGGDRDARANPAARDRAGAARRPAQQFVSGGPACQGHLRAGVRVGERPVRRRARAGADACGALYPVSRRGRGRAARRRSADPARSGSAARSGARRAGRGRDGRAGAADRRGARLDPDRACDADRGGRGRRGRRDSAGRAAHRRCGARAGLSLRCRFPRSDRVARGFSTDRSSSC